MEGLAELAFRRHHAQIYRYLRRKTGDQHRAEDLAQEVFADAAAALGSGEWQPDSLPAWLYTIAQRRFADEARRRQHSVDRVPLDDYLEELPAMEYKPHIARALGNAISRLPIGQRRVISMKLLHGSSFAEIAVEIKSSEAAAKMRFQRALRAVRADLERQGIDP